MAQRNPITSEADSAVEAARKKLERLAAEQQIRPVTDLDSLKADFWPEDESVDEFVRSMRERRRASERRSVE